MAPPAIDVRAWRVEPFVCARQLAIDRLQWLVCNLSIMLLTYVAYYLLTVLLIYCTGGIRIVFRCVDRLRGYIYRLLLNYVTYLLYTAKVLTGYLYLDHPAGWYHS
ncbi:hypothetical protein DFH09DRAFT_128810 [Mycena vulgaris]|nr:hypothetical protein DFH09DRAFT_128810 [Mycena vulgaris]